MILSKRILKSESAMMVVWFVIKMKLFISIKTRLINLKDGIFYVGIDFSFLLHKSWLVWGWKYFSIYLVVADTKPILITNHWGAHAVWNIIGMIVNDYDSLLCSHIIPCWLFSKGISAKQYLTKLKWNYKISLVY